jgi:ariadne-1
MKIDGSNSRSLQCAHRFCLDCYTQWARSEMDKGPVALFTPCPQYKCKEIIPDDVMLALLDEKKRDMYKRWMLKNFIENTPGMRWCINPNCSRAILYDSGGSRDVECQCGQRFCFACLEEAHSPAPCHLVKSWIQKNNSDKENTDWLLANTRICPQCRVPIEKNAGCNHMTCRHCKHEFWYAKQRCAPCRSLTLLRSVCRFVLCSAGYARALGPSMDHRLVASISVSWTTRAF